MTHRVDTSTRISPSTCYFREAIHLANTACLFLTNCNTHSVCVECSRVFKHAAGHESRISTCACLTAFNLFVDIQCISYVCVIFFREPNLLTKTLDTARYNELQQNLKVIATSLLQLFLICYHSHAVSIVKYTTGVVLSSSVFLRMPIVCIYGAFCL